jgi:RNA polymerase sigma factor for flagellar operon FliA
VKAYAPRSPVRDPVRDRLIAEHMDMARRIALRVARRTPEWVREEDLISAAMVGLAESAERYDASRGEPFVGFAERRIRGAVLDELRRGDLLPRRQRWAARKVGEVIRTLEHRMGRPPEDTEIAAELGVPVEEYREQIEVLTTVGFVELTPGVIEGQQELGPEGATFAQVERSEMVRLVRTALGRLAARDAQVLSLYYVEELNYGEIGQVLGVTESRVCQLHARAIARLRIEMEPDGDGAGPGPTKGKR